MNIRQMLVLIIASCVCVMAEEFEIKPGFKVIDSVSQFREVMAGSDLKIRMKPGTYIVKDALPDNKTVFAFEGSNSYFDMRGVTIQIDTKVLANMRGKVHSLAVYRVLGDNITFEGGIFEDIGEDAPYTSLSEFSVTGDDAKFLNCKFIIRGSSPYGYGDMYGKGAGASANLQKHAALGISGDRCLVDGCDFSIETFGHGIHIHGGQDTVIKNVTMLGRLRLTDEIYQEKEGIAAKYDYKIMYPDWIKGQPIPRGQMLSLTEDGIRAYLEGEDKNGKNRRTGHITVENCKVVKMRGGITVCMAQSASITNCTVLDSGGHAYSVPSNGIVRDCKGNAAYSPLLSMPYSNKSNADIELELVEAENSMGDHPLAEIVGSGHKIKISYNAAQKPQKLRPIIVGTTGGRYTEGNTAPEELKKNNLARKINLDNQSPNPVELTEYAVDCQIKSVGKVSDPQ